MSKQVGNNMEKLADIQQNYAQWYLDVIAAAELADQSPTRGCMVIRPYGYAMWEHIVSVIDAEFKTLGIENAYFPLLIPESFLKKEAKHVEGFSPELAVVTHAGGKELEEPYVVRPTSETIIYAMFAKWIKSWRDLPLKINQWSNVIRWEMRTRPFLRTGEFLWQEGHTAHATHEEALEMAIAMQDLYVKFITDYLAIPLVKGEKTPKERFAGAEHTFTFEGCMGDGKALQMGTSHVLAYSFAKAFDVEFQAQDGSIKSPYCTSWAVTTRLIGAMIMVHGDQQGIIVPPKIAPIQVVIVPIFKTEEEKAQIMLVVSQMAADLKGRNIRVKIDDDTQKTPGAKFYYWEVRGVPVRIEIGMKDLAAQQAVLVNRVETEKALKKTFCPLSEIVPKAQALLETIQSQLFERATQKLKSFWHHADKLTIFGPELDANNGFYQTGWCGKVECEEQLKAFKGTIRCILKENKHAYCFACDAPSISDIVAAKSY